jgi:hypothetical protein
MQKLNFYYEPDYFYCPVTGNIILDPEEFTPSPALMFFYLHEPEAFEYVNEKIKEHFPGYFTEAGDIINSEKLYRCIVEKGYLDKNERILVQFGQLSLASMCFDFSITKKPVEEGLKSV